jgi:hypothetical protein
LPVGEIETDSKGKYIVRLGHRIQELTQELWYGTKISKANKRYTKHYK